MKSSLLLAAVAAAAFAPSAHAQDGSFTVAEKALWVDRHNYFRMTGLPFSAANMMRMKWSDDLAGAALADAKGCAAATGPGINAHTHSSAATGSVIDAAMKEWAVNGAYSALAKVKSPGSDGLPVGTGVYNSYSQVVWAATSQVGCGYSVCTAGKLVVCKYTAPGNSANEPWFVHAPTSSQCPSGTQAQHGLCVVPGDAGNTDLAPIPDGQHTYEVFSTFLDTIHKVLKGEAVTPDAGPMAGGTGASTNPNGPATPTPTPAPVPTVAPSTPAPSPSMHESGDIKTGGSAAGAAGKAIDFNSLPTTAGDKPGTVNAGSHAGTAFSNATPATVAPKKATEPTDELSDEAGTGTANNKSDGGDDDDNGGFSAAGVAGAIVVGCVMVAGAFVFVSYRKNQQRQRDIMQNGGIHRL